MDKKQLEIRNNERQKIGKYLHDHISNDLMALQFFLAKNKNQPNTVTINEIIEKIDFLRRQIRAISHIYTIEDSENNSITDLKAEIKDLIIDSAHIYEGVEFNYHVYPKKNKIPIQKNKCLELLTVLKEVILNAINHGDSSSVELNLTKHDNEISILISDNGIGFDTKKEVNGIGLQNIKERMESINGKAIIDSQPNYGTTINLDLTIN